MTVNAGQLEYKGSAPLRVHRTGGHCGSAALRDLLEHHRLDYGDGPLAESEVFALGGGLSIVFSEQTPGGLGTYVLGRSHTLEHDLCSNLGADSQQHSTDDPALAWAWVKREIDAGRPVMVWADIGDLDYLDVRMHNSHHDVIVVGYDLTVGEVLLADHALPGVQRCRLESFAAARASNGFPGPHGNRTWLLSWPETLPPARDAFAHAAADVAERILGGEEGVIFATGMLALAQLRAAVASWERLEDRALRDQLRRLWFCIEKAGTGGGLFRALWADGLRCIAQRLESPQLARLGELYEELATLWSALAADALALGRPQVLPAIAARIDSIVQLEERGARNLATWARSSHPSTFTTREEP